MYSVCCVSGDNRLIRLIALVYSELGYTVALILAIA